MTVSVRTHKADVTAAALPEGPWDVIFFGDTVNELFREARDPVKARAALVAKAAGGLSDGGSIVIVEPALKATSKALAGLRDTLAREHGFAIYAPCAAGGACPLAEEGRERDWCHTGVVWARPKIVAQIDHLADRKKLVAKFSYCIARRREEHPVEPGPGETMFRVAGDLLEEKGKRHALLCGMPGCLKFTLLDRDENESNEAFMQLCRGDIVAIDKWDERKDGPRLGRESRVRLLRRFA